MQWEDNGYPLNAARGGCFISGASQRIPFEYTGRPEKVLVSDAWIDGSRIIEGHVCFSESWFVEAARLYGMIPPPELEALQHELSDTKHALAVSMHEAETYRKAVIAIHAAAKEAGLE